MGRPAGEALLPNDGTALRPNGGTALLRNGGTALPRRGVMAMLAGAIVCGAPVEAATGGADPRAEAIALLRRAEALAGAGAWAPAFENYDAALAAAPDPALRRYVLAALGSAEAAAGAAGAEETLAAARPASGALNEPAAIVASAQLSRLLGTRGALTAAVAELTRAQAGLRDMAQGLDAEPAAVLTLAVETAEVARAVAAGDLATAGTRLDRAARALDALPPSPVRDGLSLDLAAAALGDGVAGPLCPPRPYDDGYAGGIEALLAPLLAQRDARLLARAEHAAALLAARRCDLAAAQAASARALRAAQAVGRPDLLFAVNRRRAEIALARLDTQTALGAYRAAFEMLAGLRDDLAGQVGIGGRPLYRARLEPFHRAYIEVLLLQARLGNDQVLLAEARAVIEDLKVVEVEDYFRERCVRVADAALPVLPDETVVLYPVILENRLELLVARGQRLTRYASPVGEAALNRLVAAAVPALRDPGVPWELAALRLYRALVQPVSAELFAPGVETVMFVPDGALRQVPFATAYDGRRFLVERLNVGTLLGLTLQGGAEIERQRIDALVGGAPETAVPDFAPLTEVAGETEAVAGLLGTEPRLGDSLTAGQFRALLRGGRFNMVHVAAHARFGETPEENLIALSDGAVTVDALVQALRARAIETDRRLDLLTLSACETAVGSDAAPLGLAGAAFRADVSSVLASLWQVPDAPTARLMEGFYANLVVGGLGRAAALAKAQRDFLDAPGALRHPARWGAFIMLGEWR